MRRTLLMLILSACAAGAAAETDATDRETLDRWSAPYRGWHYWPDHVISAKPQIPGHEAFGNTDCPTVFQLPGSKAWHMSFIAFDGKGYSSFVAESDDLVHWTAHPEPLSKAGGIGLITSKPLRPSPR